MPDMPDTSDPIPPTGCERQLLAFAETLPIGIVVLEGERIARLNPAARVQFADAASALHGEPVATLFDGAHDATALLAEPPPANLELTLRRADGTAFRADVGMRTLRFGHREVRLLTVGDLSENDRIRAQVAQHHDELQAMTHRLLCVQEEERRTLSRELHDDIGQQLTAIKLGAMALQGDDDAERRAAILAEIVETTDQTVAKVRDLSLLLRPPQLDALGLEAALRWQAGVMFRNAPPRLLLDIEPLPARAPPAVELACFRIAQEALTNVLRHAHAQQVRLELAQRGNALVLGICDDGQGFAGSGPVGLGLVTMRERAQQLGGSLEIESDRQRGTSVRARLPLRPAATSATFACTTPPATPPSPPPR
jgi:signal transduction histidine kinase